MTEIGRSRISIYNLLKEKPLFNYVNDGQINVLILGTGWIGNEAIKCIFANGQSFNYQLNITIASKDVEEYKSKAMQSMPELANFATIDGVIPSKESYANIYFKEADIPTVKEQGFPEGFIESLVDDIKKINYVVIALGDDKTNELLAYLLADILNENANLVINYYSDSVCSFDENKLVNKFSLVDNFDSSELFKLANNINYLYSSFSKDVNYDDTSASFLENYKKEFINNNECEDYTSTFIGKTKEYNVDSSIASALHIYTKLHYLKKQLGLDDDLSVEDSLRELSRCIDRKDNLYYELVALEHRRWNAFMIIRGYRYPTDEELIELGINRKNDDKRIHICLCKCSTQESAFKRNKNNWIEPNFKKMSELDIVSYRYYEANKKAIDHEKINSIIKSLDRKNYGFYIRTIENLLADNDLNAHVLYGAVYKRLTLMNLINEEVEKLDELLKPAVQVNRKIDFLAIDEQIINMTPFCFELIKGRKDVICFVNGPITTEAFIPLSLLAKNVTFIQLDTQFDINHQQQNVRNFYLKHGNNIFASVKKCSSNDDLVEKFLSYANDKTVLALSNKMNLEDNSFLTGKFKDSYPIIVFNPDNNSISDISNRINVANYKNFKTDIVDMVALLNGEQENDVYEKTLPPYEDFLKSGFITFYLMHRNDWNGNYGICNRLFSLVYGIPLNNKPVEYDNTLIELIKIMVKLNALSYSDQEKKLGFVNQKLFDEFFTGYEYKKIDEITNEIKVSKSGSALEIITYFKTLWTGLFSDVQPNVDFRWGIDKQGNSTRNEFDVIAMPLTSTKPLLISVKSTHALTANYIYEILSHAMMFEATPILVAKGEDAVDQFVSTRAKVSGVHIITANDMVDSAKYKVILEKIIANNK